MNVTTLFRYIAIPLIAILFLLSGKTQAQITITMQDLEASFDEPLSAVEQVSFQTGALANLVAISGEDQVWDFTGLNFEAFVEGTYSLTYDSEGLPFADDPHYSTADAVIIFQYEYVEDDEHSGPYEETLYGYLKMEDNQAVSLGTVGSIPEFDDYMRFYSYPGEVDFEFPTTYGSSWEFSYDFEMIVPPAFSDERQYDVTAEVDGWGQAVTSEATTDVLRIKLTKETEFMGTPVTEVSYRFVDQNGRQIAEIHTDPFGNPEEGSVFHYQSATSSERDPEIAENVTLEQNYPNPFNPVTQIGFTLDMNQTVSLSVYDVVGRKVADVLQNKSLAAGEHTVPFDASALTSGVYIYRLQLNNGTILTRKMTLVK